MKIKQYIIANCFILACSLFIFIDYLINGAKTIDVKLFGAFGYQFNTSFSFNFLTALLSLMASFLSLTISHYSYRYLAGEERQRYFFKFLTLLSLSVFVFILTDNLLVIFLTWLIISFALHRLLTYYHDRTAALEAAIKKLLVSRLGDIFLIAGLAISYRAFSTFEISDLTLLLEQTLAVKGETGVFTAIAILFAFGALLKSVQFPFHFWLPDTMETPTPVSALMHAGVVNAGGILMIKMSQLISFSETASAILAISGAVSAIFGSMAMVTQNNIKKKLAYSTISQMGMMMLACGLGLFGVALFHIFAHSLYKAHAFLSTGSIVEESVKIQCKPYTISGYLITTIVLIAATAIILTHFISYQYFAYAVYLSILLMGFSNGCFVSGFKPLHVTAYFKGLGIILFAFFLYITIEILLHQRLLFEQVVGDHNTENGLFIATGYLSFIIFSVGLFFSNLMLAQKNELARRLYVFFWNGGYFSLVSSIHLRKIIRL